MPFIIRKDDSGKYCVYTQGADGEPKGKAHGCHPSQEAAREQQKALYANVPDARMAVATFDLADPQPAGDMVIRRGKVFQAGSYPDKRFDITPEEMAAAASEFRPVPNDLEHRATILSGKLGDLRSVSVGADPWDLHGEVAIPGWLDSLLGKEPLKVSTTWDRAAKRITGLGLVIDPRVSDAAVMGAYTQFAARHDTPTGQQGLQELHDHAARLGAVCSPGNAAKMASSHEAKVYQQVHDLTADHGATCASGKRPSWAIYGADSAGRTDMSDTQDKAPGRMESFLAWLSGGNPAAPGATPAPPAAGADTARFTALEKQAADDRAALLFERGKRLASEAAAFADRIINAERAQVAERETIIALHVRAAEDDAAGAAEVTFGRDKDGKPVTGSRVAAVEASYNLRPAGRMRRETIPGGLPEGAVLLGNATGEEEELARERKESAEWYQRTHGKSAAGNGANGGK